MKGLSQRVMEMEHSPIRALVPYALAAQERGRTVLFGNIGQPDLATPALYREAALSYYADENRSRTIAYGPSEGMLEFRLAYANFLRRQGIAVDKEDVFITVAASEALLLVLMTICDPGDEIIVPEPFYTNYRTFCAMAGVNIVPVTLVRDSGYRLPDISVFEEAITPNTRALLLCSPNNPTGSTYDSQELTRLLEFCATHGLYLVTDEVYREFVFDRKPLSVLQLPHANEHAIVVDSLSKRYSLCGARVGMIVCKQRMVLEQVLKMSQARLCPVSAEQLLSLPLLDHGDAEIIRMRDLYKKRLDHLCDLLTQLPGVQCNRPQGGFYVMVQLPVNDAFQFAKYMVSEIEVDGYTLLVAPAAGFYMTKGLGQNEIRMAAVMDEESIHRAVKILAKAIECQRKQVSLCPDMFSTS